MPAQAADPVTLNILTVNDFHGYIDNTTLKFAGTIEQLRQADGASGANTLLVGAGDFIGASQFASSVAEDQPTIDVFNALGLPVSAVGNHEFDKGWPDLRDRVIGPDGARNAKWDYLAANVYAEGTETPILPEYGLYEAGGLTIGVVGVVTQETPTLVSPGGVVGLTFGDPVEAVNRVAGQLTDGDDANGEADVVVASYHEGAGSGALTLDENVATSPVFAHIVNDTSAKVAAIINGHTHQAYAYNAPVPGDPGRTRPIVQTGNYGTNVGQITLTVDRDTNVVQSSTVRTVPRVATDDAVLLQQYPSLQAVQDIVTDALAYAAVIGNQPVGTLTADVTTAIPDRSQPVSSTNRDDRAKESTLGTLVADAVLATLAPPELGGAQIAVVNPGGLRNELLYAKTPTNDADADGRILYSEANSILPFVNNLATVDMTGAQLKTLLEQQWQRDAAGNVPSRSYLALGTSSGFGYTFDPALPEGSRVTGIMLNGTPVDPAATYRVGTFTFLTGTGNPASAGGDNFHVFRQATNFKDSGLIDRDAWIAYLQAHQPVSPDFRKHSVSVTGLDPAAVVGATQSVAVGSFDLTSAGAPANTSVTATFSKTSDGAGAVQVGTAAVEADSATVDVTFPASAVGAGFLTFTAQPSGTTAVIPVTVAAPAATVTATAKAVEYGTAGKIAVTVASPGTTPAGTVTVADAAGTVLGTANLSNGKATVTLGRTALAPGTHSLTVSYGGSAAVGAGSTTIDLVVNKASSSIGGLSTTLLVAKGKASKVAVLAIANGGVPVEGAVSISYDGKVIGTGTLKNGSASIAIAPFTSRGIKVLSISFDGSATVAGSKGPGLVLVL
ncbi:5'-nucleotidase C-terminal domain-containing protein [Microbacterium ulmi]|uniref:5'-nucleotidase n=1 Tax=Microbacterium ulmi TaxID=179095 RepID=A0A7Y2Q216_9MICO|nr:5'-nucleotidase [Microbacterium ulmi]NNH04525.1 hypothetical protein [Microbacterium ulmi]